MNLALEVDRLESALNDERQRLYELERTAIYDDDPARRAQRRHEQARQIVEGREVIAQLERELLAGRAAHEEQEPQREECAQLFALRANEYKSLRGQVELQIQDLTGRLEELRSAREGLEAARSACLKLGVALPEDGMPATIAAQDVRRPYRDQVLAALRQSLHGAV